MVKTYVKNPVTVRAKKYGGTNGEEIKAFAGASAFERDGVLCIHSKEGDRAVKVGDYVVQGVEGEFFAAPRRVLRRTTPTSAATSTRRSP